MSLGRLLPPKANVTFDNMDFGDDSLQWIPDDDSGYPVEAQNQMGDEDGFVHEYRQLVILKSGLYSFPSLLVLKRMTSAKQLSQIEFVHIFVEWVAEEVRFSFFFLVADAN